MVVSPIGIVPKKEPGKYRLIHHLSFPYGDSVNDGIPREYTSVLYASIQDAIKLIQLHGPGCFLAKTDRESAFKIVPVHPSESTYWASHGTAIFTTTNVSPLVVSVRVTFSKRLVRRWSGRPKINFTSPGFCTCWTTSCSLPLPVNNASLAFYPSYTCALSWAFL